MPSTTKTRLLDTTAGLLRRQGYAATGMKQIAGEAHAPFGSIYHFFPGGKEQLCEEVIRTSGRSYVELFESIVTRAPDAPTGVAWFFDGAALLLSESGYEDACPVATVALEVANTNETLRQAVAEVFEEWIAAATSYFARFEIPRARGRELALQMLCLLEGSFVFARSLRDTEPVRVAGEASVAAVCDALAHPTGQPRRPERSARSGRAGRPRS